MLSTFLLSSSGSIIELANRATRTSLSGSRPSQWSTRYIASSGKYFSIVALSALAPSRSLPNGFSTITRAPSARPAPRVALGDTAEQERRHLEVEQRTLPAAHLLRHRRVGRRVVEIAVDVTQQAEHLA